MTIPQRYQKIIKRWEKIPLNYSEQSLELHFIQFMFDALGYSADLMKSNVSLGKKTGLKADHLIFSDPNQPPVLVVEVKKRIAALANATSDDDFLNLCNQPNSLYKLAVGHPDLDNNNGIKQYLNKSNENIDTNCLASYGLVINGDFFQIWRRVEGLILPLTPLHRMTARTLPKLLKKLEYCLTQPQRALVITIWNRKGGVAKTTNTVNVSATLALQNKRVLSIDLDSQTDLTEAFQIDPKKHERYLEQCLTKIQAGDLDAAKLILQSRIQTRTYKTSDGKQFSVDILPGEPKTLDRIRDDKLNYGANGKTQAFRQAIDLLTESYDYIFIDACPAGDDLTKMMLYSCDAILITSDYGRKTLNHSVRLYQRYILNVRKDREKRGELYIGPWNLGLLFSNCPPRVTSSSQLEQFVQMELERQNFKGRQCKTRLQIYAHTKLAEYKNFPVIFWQNLTITNLYKQLVDEILLTHHFVDD